MQDCKTFLESRINKKVYLTSKGKVLHKYILSVNENDTVTTITNLKKELTHDSNGKKISYDEEDKETTFKISIIDGYYDLTLYEAYFTKEKSILKGVNEKREILTFYGPFIKFEKNIITNRKKQHSLYGLITQVNGYRIYIKDLETSDFLHNRTIDILNSF
jgi:hypothetical protein